MIRRWELGIGLFGLLFAAIVVLIWVPHDIKGAFLETTRAGKPDPGDAFFPVLLGIMIGVISLLQILSAFLRSQEDRDPSHYARLRPVNMRFLAIFTSILAVSIGVLFWTGPLFVWIFETGVTYRQMVDTAPYKYIGLSLGGFLMTFTFIAWAEGRLRWRSAVVSVALIAFLILIFDGLLDNIQLPPNADF